MSKIMYNGVEQEGTNTLPDNVKCFAKLRYYEISQLEGMMLTLVDASIADDRQCKALKDMVRQTIWWRWAQNLADRTDPTIPVGMPLTTELSKA